jgi:hypothetical protein
VLSCVGRDLGAGLIPRPRSPTKCLKGSISKNKNPTPEKGIKNNEKEEEEIRGLRYNGRKRQARPCRQEMHKNLWSGNLLDEVKRTKFLVVVDEKNVLEHAVNIIKRIFIETEMIL